jgi:hypothetical protein
MLKYIILGTVLFIGLIYYFVVYPIIVFTRDDDNMPLGGYNPKDIDEIL